MKKISIFILSLLLNLTIFSFAASAADLLVTKATNSNDGACDADCSLREAVAAAANSGDTVIFSSSLIGQTFVLGGSEIVISKQITIDGFINDPNVVFLSGNSTSRHFFITTTGNLTIRNMTLVSGSGAGINPGNGGSIAATGNASLTLDRVSIRGNEAAVGGALHLFNNGVHKITNSSITGNTVSGGAGAVLVGGTTTLYMSNTTVSNNRSLNPNDPDAYGALANFGSMRIRNCTIVDNEGGLGGGLYAGGNGAILGNTIIAYNTATQSGTDIQYFAGDVTSLGGNLVGSSNTIPGGVFVQSNDVMNVNPLVAGPNASVGGFPVNVHTLQAGSPAIDTGINSLAVEPLSGVPLTQDARGGTFARISNGTVDKGAFEDETGSTRLIVSKKDNSSDGACDIDCSLREAVAQGAVDPGTDTITFLPSVFGIMTLGGTEIFISNNDLNIVGYPDLSADILTMSGGDTNRIFRIANSDVTFTGLTLSGGNGVGGLNSGFGGAVYVHSGGNLTLDKVIVRDNAAASAYGAMYLLGGSHRILNTTIHNNQAPTCIGVGNVNGTLNMANTTITTNTDSDGGAGVGALCNTDATANLRNSTISFNRVSGGTNAGIWSNSTLSLGNTLITNNIAPGTADLVNAGGVLTSVGGNLITDPNGFSATIFVEANDQLGVDPLLGALLDNGGNVTTHAVPPTSPANNYGVNAAAVDPFDNTPLQFDARGLGFNRIQNGIVDKGAFEALTTTSALVSVGGRVTVNGRGLLNAAVYMTDQQGNLRISSTSSFGYYHFDNIEVGHTYTISVVSKRYPFNPRVVSVMDELTDLDFTPIE
jgi:hypothetical protein